MWLPGGKGCKQTQYPSDMANAPFVVSIQEHYWVANVTGETEAIVIELGLAELHQQLSKW